MASFLIYCDQKITTRLLYVTEWIFSTQFSLTFEITRDRNKFLDFEGPKLNYSKEHFDAAEILKIVPAPLLFEKDIREQALALQRWKQTTVLFYNQPGAAIPFDLFAAVFYLLSRYEEYLPHTKDNHGRFPAEQALAFIYRFLDQPVVDEWLLHFGTLLSEKLNAGIKRPEFKIQHTFDVDLAWKYLHKGSKRTLGAFGRDLLTGKWQQVKERKEVLSGNKTDPYYSFPILSELHQKNKIKPLFFILLGKLGAFDKNAAPDNPAMQELMKNLAQQYDCGIHPSYGSHQNPGRLKTEISCLASAIQKPVTKSRQHYIKFSLPESYRNLIHAGIKDDYSMGYASVNGFRAGTSHSFLWYDLKAEKIQNLRIHPFIFMDATCRFYLKYNTEETFKEWLRFYKCIKKTNGCFVSIWHNFILSLEPEKKSWLSLYRRVLENVPF